MSEKTDCGQNKGKESKLKQTRKRYDDVTRMFDRLYEDSLEGRIYNDNFTRLMEKYQAEQKQLLLQIDALEHSLKEVKESETKAVKWADLMAACIGLQELTAEILNRLIEKMEVYSRTEEDGEVGQEIKIFYRFGGYINKRCFAAMVLKRRRAKVRKAL